LKLLAFRSRRNYGPRELALPFVLANLIRRRELVVQVNLHGKERAANQRAVKVLLLIHLQRLLNILLLLLLN
jgi:hypothetical protein